MITKSFDLITIGDSTIDTFIRVHDATVECDINRRDCKICLQYGSKIPVDSIAFAVAGNAANVAVGASRLGLRTAIYTNLGDDDQGRRIKDKLVSSNIATDYIQTIAGKKSNLSVVLTFKGERTIFVYHQDWSYRLPDMIASNFVYLTSMAESFTGSHIMDEVVRYVIKNSAKLVFAPGTYQLKADIKKYPKILENCASLIVNMDEAKGVLSIDSKERVEPRDILSRLLLLGPKVVVITDGEAGSYCSDGQRNFKIGVYPTKVVEKTGAGDAYSSGFIAALAQDQPLEEALVWGTINAAHEIGQLGTQNGLLTTDELLNAKKIVPELVAVLF